MNARPSPGTGGYSLRSIVVHWLAAILVVALFFTHEGERGSTANLFHVSGGAIVGLFLLWRVWRRVQRGSTHPPEQAAIFNFAARLVHWGLLVAIVVVVVSGYLLPWSLGRELDVFGFGIPSRWERTETCTSSWNECTTSRAISSFRSSPCTCSGPSSTPFSTGELQGFACSSPPMEAGDNGEVTTTRDAMAPSVVAIFPARFARYRRNRTFASSDAN